MKNKNILGVFIDLSKVFDAADHANTTKEVRAIWCY